MLTQIVSLPVYQEQAEFRIGNRHVATGLKGARYLLIIHELLVAVVFSPAGRP